jgi:exosortase E/protease (VPEID-CTERM system)
LPLSRYIPRYLLGRLYLLAAILAADCAIVASIPHAAPLLGPVAPSGIVAFAVFLGLGRSRLCQHREQIAFHPGWFCAHLACVAAVFLANLAVDQDGNSWLNTPWALLASGLVLATGILLLALACFPLKVWIAMARDTSPASQYAAVAGIAAWFLRSPFQLLWIHASATNVYFLQSLTFRSVQVLLGFLLPNLVVDAGPFVIGTPRFSVSVGAPCSGIEGLGLVLVFTLVWLWFFRKENRFPQALLLIPGALLCAFLLNVVRIATLILIGNAGAPEVAFVGFHSQAGWIAFTLVALGFSLATQKLAWVKKSVPGPMPAGGSALGPTAVVERDAAPGESPATRAYLIPLLAILAASFIAKSASGYFEWLYPLRFVAAGLALWLFRREYRTLNWRFGWAAPLTGAGIFLIWLAPEWLAHSDAASPLGAALASLSPGARITWIAVRVAAAVITVPIAEELAFRGYFARRLVAREFDEVPFARLTLISIGLSSLVFGLMHGQHWLAGIVAGLAYALLLKSKGRMGDAVVAHAVSNLLLAAWVLGRGDWGLW